MSWNNAAENLHIGFDLCAMKKTSVSDPYYTLQASTYDTTTNTGSKFYFNIGAAVLAYPDALCSSTTFQYKSGDGTMVTITGLIDAYKVEYQNNVAISCEALTRGHTYMKPLTFDESGEYYGAVADGVQYYFGDGMYNPGTGRNMALEILFVCNHGKPISPTASVYYKYNKGHFLMSLNTSHACPTACHVDSQGNVCGGKNNGFCSYDFTTPAKAKCFCLKGFTGNSCTTPVSNDVVVPISKTPTPDPSAFVKTFGPNNAVLYDISGWKKPASHYRTVIDTNNVENSEAKGIKIYYNFFTKIDTGSVPVTMPAKCRHMAANTYYAFAYFVELDECYALGDTISWFLYDTTKPAKGFSIRTNRGPVSGDTKCNERSLRFDAQCPTQDVSMEAVIPDVLETTDVFTMDSSLCELRIPLYMSAYACPWLCYEKESSLSGFYKICNNNGVCNYDNQASQMRCFCSSGYDGPTCSQVAPSPAHTKKNSISPWIYVAFINVVILTIIIGLSIFCYKKWKKGVYLEIKSGVLEKDLIDKDATSDATTSAFEDDKLIAIN